jgi:molybdate transport system regulatory protein
MRYGARNQLVGNVVAIKKGTVMCQVTVEIAPKMRVSSVMTLDSLKELGIKKGSAVHVLIKAVNVLLATED